MKKILVPVLAALIAAISLSACGGGGGGGSSSTSSTSTSSTSTASSDTTAPVCTASKAAGTYSSAQSVSISCDETATVYYTTDGTTPVASKPSELAVSELRAVYSSAIAVSSSLTLKFFGKDAAGNSQSVVSVAYVIDSTAPTAAITNNSGKTAFKNGNTSTFTATFTEAVSSASISSTCTGNATGIFSATMSGSGTSWTYSFTAGTGDGTCTISLSASDAAGNAVASVSGNSYSVDNTATAAPTVSTVDGFAVTPNVLSSPNANPSIIAGTCPAGSTSITSDVGTASALSSLSWTVSVPVTGAVIVPQIKCVDEAGNQSGVMSTFAGIQ